MSSLIMYGSLAVAISAEIIGTSLLAASQQFTKLWPTLGMIACYGLAFYFLSISLKFIPVGIAYAIWSGVGVAAIALIGHFFFRQTLDMAAILGIMLIVSGVVVLNVFSKSFTN